MCPAAMSRFRPWRFNVLVIETTLKERKKEATAPPLLSEKTPGLNIVVAWVIKLLA